MKSIQDRQRFRATADATARVLLLIDEFSGYRPDSPVPTRSLEGRVKLAKLDFLLRYPKFALRILRNRVNSLTDLEIWRDESPIDTKMVRFRYGPWDPSYYAVLGSLIGRGLVESVPITKGIGFRTSPKGHELAQFLRDDASFEIPAQRLRLLRRHLDLSGTKLKDMLYAEVPEMTNARWNDELTQASRGEGS